MPQATKKGRFRDCLAANFATANAEIARTRANHEIPDVANSSILGRCRIRGHRKSRPRPPEVGLILRAYEEAGDAMRHLNAKGKIAWKATPRMLSRLADAEREARDDLADS